MTPRSHTHSGIFFNLMVLNFLMKLKIQNVNILYLTVFPIIVKNVNNLGLVGQIILNL